MAEPHTTDWAHQLGRHFRPFAQKERQGYFLTAVIPYPEHKAALCIRIADRRIHHHNEAVRAELERHALATIRDPQQHRRVFGNVDINCWNPASLATGGVSSLGVYVLTNRPVESLLAGLMAICCAALYQGYQAGLAMNQARQDAEAVVRQFHATGPPPTSQIYLPDRNLSTAALFHAAPTA